MAQTTEQKLAKTRNSINAAMERGSTMNSKVLQGLVDRYNDLKSEFMRKGPEPYKRWVSYCQESGACPSHNGYDLVA